MAEFTPKFTPIDIHGDLYSYTDENGEKHIVKSSEMIRIWNEYEDKNRTYDRNKTTGTFSNGATYTVTGKRTDRNRKMVITTADGKTIKLDLSHGKHVKDGFKSNNAKGGATMEHVKEAFIHLMTTGRNLNAADLGVTPKQYETIMKDVRTMAKRNGIELDDDYNITEGFDTSFFKTQEDIEAEQALANDPKAEALNRYYRDTYSLEEGTTGKRFLDRFEQGFKNRAAQEMVLADAQYQQAALLQAQKVKQITDQVRSERMARLRAGMSESQIANQDMQMLMANVGALNDQAQALNEGRLQAQLGYNTAQDQAFEAYLNQANQQIQGGASLYASQVGDINYQVQQYLRRQGIYNPTAKQWADTTRLFSTGSEIDANRLKDKNT